MPSDHAAVYHNYTFFAANTVASTGYMYKNISSATAAESATAGEICVSGYNWKTLQVSCTNMSASTSKIWYRIEGRMNGMSTYGSILTASIVVATAIDDLVNIQEMVDYVRVGVKRVGQSHAPTSAFAIIGYLGENY